MRKPRRNQKRLKAISAEWAHGGQQPRTPGSSAPCRRQSGSASQGSAVAPWASAPPWRRRFATTSPRLRYGIYMPSEDLHAAHTPACLSLRQQPGPQISRLPCISGGCLAPRWRWPAGYFGDSKWFRVLHPGIPYLGQTGARSTPEVRVAISWRYRLRLRRPRFASANFCQFDPSFFAAVRRRS